MPAEQLPQTATPTSVIPSAAQLARYSAIDPNLPAQILRSRDRQLQREFAYAGMSLGAGVIALLAIVGGYVYLSMHGHPGASGVLLGAGVLSLIGGIVRSRLHG